MLAVSPHCDDAVFACGERLWGQPGSLVVTVFAGDPAPGAPLTGWDRDCGFREGDDVMQTRRAEDRCAFGRLDAHGEWLAFRDSQYGASPAPGAIAAALHAIVLRDAPREVGFPLGLFHSDHLLVSEAVLTLVPTHPEIVWSAYEDALYREIEDAVPDRVDTLRRRGLVLRVAPAASTPTALARKRAAVACYRSQLRGLHTPSRLGHRAALAPEAYWRIRA